MSLTWDINSYNVSFPSSCFFHFLLPLYFIVSFSQQTNPFPYTFLLLLLLPLQLSLSSCVFKIVTQTAPSPLRFLSHVYQVGSPLSIPYSDVYSFPCFCENFADDHTLSLSIVYFWLFASLHFYVHGSACSVFFYNAVLCYYYCVVVLLEKRSTPVSQFLFKISDNW